ncbi:S8 family serine peptidase [Rubricoccus marinus]|uniref:S8 family serine peptidase n=1 Tax=Rubricoccus marinus TaxID=716817 RepID=UPI0015C5880E|nr:S8 family serine peptidase [Rubricoccus marinus]
MINPLVASDEVFRGQDVRRRGYIQDSTPGVAITVSNRDLALITTLLEINPLVASVEFDISFALPSLGDPYAPLRHDYTGGLRDLALGADPTFSGQMTPWNIEMVGGHRSSAASGDGTGTVDVDVYVIDSGVDHPDVHVVESATFFQEGAGPGSSLHGNHVAAIIAAKDDGSGTVGVAPGARVHSLDVFDASGQARMSQILAALDHVIAAKRADPSRPMVINMSLGASTGTTEHNALDRAVEVALAEGITVVISAGNDATDAALVSPAHVEDAITVGAVDSRHLFAFDFSNRGRRVDVLAPGVRVVSAADGSRFARLDGTSMAAPHVAGAAALILAKAPGASPDAVQQTIRRTSRNTVNSRAPQTTGRTLWLARL